MIGLVDCNNFFVSCERLFNPSLEGKAVVVLSNNDGCVISRSNEAKALGIPMGLPAFKIKEYTNPNNVIKLSCRHIIYRDISDRIMTLLGNEVENLQIYSVDECFFKAPYEDEQQNYDFICNLVKKVKLHTGIPVSIGVAPSKTLAKIASHIAKKTRNNIDNVFLLTQKEQTEKILQTIPISDVWGIGRRLTETLKSYHITTAFNLAQAPLSWIRSQFSITEERIVRELNGEDCTQINSITEENKSIMSSRSFGSLIDNPKTLWEAIAYFTASCAERLRAQNSSATMISVYIRGDIHNSNLPYYANSCDIRLETPSYDTAYLTRHALKAFNRIYRNGYKYRKAGVCVSHLVKNTDIQLNIFENIDLNKQKKLMNVLDKINSRCGKGTLILGAQGTEKKWSPRKEHYAKKSATLQFYSGMTLPIYDTDDSSSLTYE